MFFENLKRLIVSGLIIAGLAISGMACDYNDDDDDGYATPTSPAYVDLGSQDLNNTVSLLLPIRK